MFEAPVRPTLAPSVYVAAAAKLLLHVGAIRGYGWFRDEFYYVACSEHLDWGYVDHPPLVAVVTWLVRHTLGSSLVALRLLPAIAGAATVLMAGVLARELRGGHRAQGLAAVSVLGSLVYLSTQHILSMNAWEPLTWAALAWLVMRALETGRTRTWAWAGLVAGLGLQNKHSLAFFAAAVFAGVLFTPARRVLRTRGPWVMAVVAGVVFLPNVLWEIGHGLPTLEFMRNAQRYKNAALPPLTFARQQILIMNPVTAVIWLAGIGWLLFARAATSWRAFGWAYVLLLALFVLTAGKDYYLSPYYPILFAAGGVALERWARKSRSVRAVAAALPAVVVIATAVLAPMAIPLLPVDTYVRYAAWLGVRSEASERHEMGRLPQFFADMHGWNELVDEVVRVAGTLPPEERAKAVILVGNYGEAGAINLLGRSRGAPLAVSGHNSYWTWGPGHMSKDIVLVLGGRDEDGRQACDSYVRAGLVRCRDCMPYENENPISICRGLRIPIEAVWRERRSFN